MATELSSFLTLTVDAKKAQLNCEDSSKGDSKETFEQNTFQYFDEDTISHEQRFNKSFGSQSFGFLITYLEYIITKQVVQLFFKYKDPFQTTR